jgi:hypothetical protein
MHDSKNRNTEIFSAILEAIGAKAGDDREEYAQYVINSAIFIANAASAHRGWEPRLGFRSDNVESAEKLRRWIDAGIGSDGEGGLIGQANSMLLWMERGGDFKPKELESLFHGATLIFQAVERRNTFLGALKELRERCDQIIKHEPGEHKSAGYVQRNAATLSRRLMELCGLELIYTNPTSVYCRVASLLFEVLTGLRDQDLERACETVARQPAADTEIS